jgi:hypothetical protein
VATDTGGVASFSSVPPGAYSVSVDASRAAVNGQPAPHFGTPASSATTLQVPFAATTNDPVAATVPLVEGELSGTVAVNPSQGSSCSTSSSVTVSIEGPATTSVPVAAGGTYHAFLPPGKYQLTFSAPGCQASTATATVVDGHTATASGSVS